MAEKMLRVVESMRKEVLGEKYADKLNAKHRIVMCLYKTQKFDCAKKCIAMYKVCEKKFQERMRLFTLSSKYLIAVCSYKRKTFVKAENMFRDLEVLKKMF